MAGYIGSKAVLLSTTAATVTGAADIGGDLTVDTNTLYVDSTNNRVGVGVSDPDSALEVQSSSSGLNSVHFANTSSTGYGAKFLGGGNTATRYIADFRDYNNVSAVRIDGDGNVGIGTSSPSALLHVDGAAGDLIKVTSPSVGTGYIGVETGYTYINANTGGAALRFETQGTERLRIDSSGNVGIGTSSIVSYPKVTIYDASTKNPGFVLQNTTTGQTSNDGFFVGLGVGGSGDANTAYLYHRESGPLVFATNNTERMRIDSSGNLLVGTTTSASANIVTSNTGQAALHCLRPSTTTSATQVLFSNNNGVVGSISTNGSTTAYNTSSDYRLKEDWQPMTGASERVLALNPVNFAWKVDGSRVDGFLAHEAQAVVPEAITGEKDAMRTEEYEVTPAIEATYDEDGNILTEAVPAVMGTREVPDYQGIDQSKLVPLLTAALQEALNEITDLKARVAALEAN